MVANESFIAFILFVAMNQQLATRTQSSRFDPAEFAPQELDSVKHLMELFLSDTRPPALVDERGERTELPKPVYELLVKVASALQEGKVITLVPETQELTTQAAANLLGVSRPHVVKLIEDGQLPCHKVGAHRRIRMKDLLAFQRLRDQSRREALDEMARRAQEAGLY
jgi:excisionase family DNA binding protein